MKDGDRVLGVDDAAFSSEDETTELVGVVYRGNEAMEDLRFSKTEVDGNDAVKKIAQLHDSCNNQDHIKAVLTNGLCVAGFNFIDIEELSDKLGKPVVAVTSNKPDRESFRKALKKAGKDPELLSHIPAPKKLESERGRVFVQGSDISLQEAEETVLKTSKQGLTPEALRVADLIGARLPSEPV